MTPDLISILILIGVALLLVVGVIVIVVRPKGWGNFASLTVYHDFQPKDKQEAIEIVMEKKAGKKMEEQESGADE
ncbi:MAG: hypothetical protein WBW71_12200 [Bacteroidota bacterium]